MSESISSKETSIVSATHRIRACIPGYCVRCLTPAVVGQLQCDHCETGFTGNGRFDLITGSPPKRSTMQ